MLNEGLKKVLIKNFRLETKVIRMFKKLINYYKSKQINK